MKKHKCPYASALKDQEMIAFNLYESLKMILRDLLAIDSLIPSETSRHAVKSMNENQRLIIQSRKDELLSYTQAICRDHMYFVADLINQGWTPKQKQKARKLPQGDIRDWLKRQVIG